MTSFNNVIDHTQVGENIFHKIFFHFHPESSKSVKKCDLQKCLKYEVDGNNDDVLPVYNTHGHHFFLFQNRYLHQNTKVCVLARRY